MNNLEEAVAKLVPALEAVDAANELLASVKETVKEELGLNPVVVIYGIKRAEKKKLNAEKVEIEDSIYEEIVEQELV